MLEKLKKKKLEQMQNQQQNEYQEQLKLQEQVEQLEMVAKQFLSPEAISRYGTLKSAHTDKAIQSLAMVVQLAQQNKLVGKLTDADYKALLVQLTPKKREFKINKK
jgi:programmed cell death protein 5